MKLEVLSPREASIFACFTDAVVAPEPALPPVRETDAVAYFDRWMQLSPKLNATGMRAMLYLLELAPVVTGYRRRLRRLSPEERARWIKDVARAPNAQLRLVWKLVKGAAQLAYYGDPGVMGRIGYDAEANARRGRELRLREGRP